MKKKRGRIKPSKREIMTTCTECGGVYMAKGHGGLCPACNLRDMHRFMLKAQ